MSGAARWNLNTFFLRNAPRITRSCADAFTTIIMIIGAFSRNYSALISGRTPGETTDEASTFTASIVSSAARRDGNTLLLSSAPGSVGSNTDATTAIIMSVETDGGNCNAGVGLRTESESRLESQAMSAIVVSFAACRNGNA